MGVHFPQVVPVVLRQAHDGVADVQFVLSHDGHATVAQEFIVMEQAARDGVLNGYHCHHLRVAAHLVEHLLEGFAAQQFHLFALEVLVGGNVVETALYALYGYPVFHLTYLIIIKNPAPFFMEAGLSIFSVL